MKQPGLLAHLSARFARSEEDWATEALTFLLRGWPEAREALRAYVLRSFLVELASDLSYQSQVTDPESGRPDVVGTEPAGDHQLIIEAKLWAGLGQPIARGRRGPWRRPRCWRRWPCCRG